MIHAQELDYALLLIRRREVARHAAQREDDAVREGNNSGVELALGLRVEERPAAHGQEVHDYGVAVAAFFCRC